MKPFYFVKDVIEQLEGFKVGTVDFELRVGGNGNVGDGDSLLAFTVDIADYMSKRDKHFLADIEKGIGGAPL